MAVSMRMNLLDNSKVGYDAALKSLRAYAAEASTIIQQLNQQTGLQGQQADKGTASVTNLTGKTKDAETNTLALAKAQQKVGADGAQALSKLDVTKLIAAQKEYNAELARTAQLLAQSGQHQERAAAKADSHARRNPRGGGHEEHPDDDEGAIHKISRRTLVGGYRGAIVGGALGYLKGGRAGAIQGITRGGLRGAALSVAGGAAIDAAKPAFNWGHAAIGAAATAAVGTGAYYFTHRDGSGGGGRQFPGSFPRSTGMGALGDAAAHAQSQEVSASAKVGQLASQLALAGQALRLLGPAGAILSGIGTAAAVAVKGIDALASSGSKTAQALQSELAMLGEGITETYSDIGASISKTWNEQTRPVRQMLEDLWSQVKNVDEGIANMIHGADQRNRGKDLDEKISGKGGISERVRASDKKMFEEAAAEKDRDARAGAYADHERRRDETSSRKAADRQVGESLDSDSLQGEIDAIKGKQRARMTRSPYDAPTPEQAKAIAGIDTDTAGRIEAERRAHEKRTQGIDARKSELTSGQYDTELKNSKAIFDQRKELLEKQAEIERKAVRDSEVLSSDEARQKIDAARDLYEAKSKYAAEDLKNFEASVRDKTLNKNLSADEREAIIADERAKVEAAKKADKEAFESFRDRLTKQAQENEKLTAEEERQIELRAARQEAIKKEKTAVVQDSADHKEALARDEGRYQENQGERLAAFNVDAAGDAKDRRAGQFRQDADHERGRAQARVDRDEETPQQAAASADKIKNLEDQASQLEQQRYEAQKKFIQDQSTVHENLLQETQERIKQREQEVKLAKTIEDAKKAEKELNTERDREKELIGKIRSDEEKLLSVEQQRSLEIQRQADAEARRAELQIQHAAEVAEAKQREKDGQMKGAFNDAMQGGGFQAMFDPDRVNSAAVQKIVDTRGKMAGATAGADYDKKMKKLGQGNKRWDNYDPDTDKGRADAVKKATDRARMAAWRSAKRQGLVTGKMPRDLPAKNKQRLQDRQDRIDKAQKKKAEARGDIEPGELADAQGDAMKGMVDNLKAGGDLTQKTIDMMKDFVEKMAEQMQRSAELEQQLDELQQQFDAQGDKAGHQRKGGG